MFHEILTKVASEVRRTKLQVNFSKYESVFKKYLGLENM